jgi:regulator of protease activity HflC (stomatin/prohibitin superfamily)
MPADINDYFKKRQNSNGNGNKNEPPRGGGNGGGGNQPPFEPPEFMKDFGKKGALFYIVVIIVVFIFVTKPYVVVNSGEVGIKITTGKYDPIPLEPGFHVYLPIVQKVIKEDTKVRIINYKTIEDVALGSNEGIKINPAINVLDKRGLPVSIELTVQYRLRPQQAPQTISTWGISWEDKIINPVVRDIVRTVIGSHTAEELPAKRNELAMLIEKGLSEKVDNLDNQPVQLTSIQLREIVLPEKIKEQIERVQIANQEAERVRYEVERAKQEAEKKAALAKGEAEAKKIRAQGNADAVLIEAQAQAKANNVVSKSLTNDLLELRQIEVQGQFNEALKVNKDAKLFLTPGGSVPNIWVDSGSKQTNTAVSR